MVIFPAIDLIDGKAVRLVKGDYGKKTVYSDLPLSVAQKFLSDGAEYLHIVDLDGAKDGTIPNFEVVESIVKNTSLKVEIGGGIRCEDTIKKYLDIGVFRVILGTAAVKNPDFAADMIKKYGGSIAIGIDIKDGYAATEGWTEISKNHIYDMCENFEKIGAETVICTDISKDGAMQGTNIELYKTLTQKFNINIVASGGVTDLSDIRKLKDSGVYGAILGKALYTKNIELKSALEAAK